MSRSCGAGTNKHQSLISQALSGEKGTDHFPEEDDVLPSDEKDAPVRLGVRPARRVEQALDRLRQDEVRCGSGTVRAVGGGDRCGVGLRTERSTGRAGEGGEEGLGEGQGRFGTGTRCGGRAGEIGV